MTDFNTSYKYQYDRTAKNPDNLVPSELKEFSGNNIIPFVMNEGVFYTEDFTLIRETDKKKLVPDVDFYYIGTDGFLNSTGHETATAVLLADVNYNGKMHATYQAVGGPEGARNSLILDLMELIKTVTKNPSVLYSNLIGVPNTFKGEEHLHPMTQVTELQRVYNALADLGNAFRNGKPMGSSITSLEETIEGLLRVQSEMQNSINRIALFSGSTTDMTSLIDRIDKIISKIDKTIPVAAGTLTTLDEWDMREYNCVEGSLHVNDNDGKYTHVKFVISWGDDHLPQLHDEGYIGNAHDRVQLKVDASGDNVRLRLESVAAGTVKTKYFMVV